MGPINGRVLQKLFLRVAAAARGSPVLITADIAVENGEMAALVRYCGAELKSSTEKQFFARILRIYNI